MAGATGEPADPRAVAEGFLRVAVANMANAIKQVSIQKGHDATRYALQCFGGAGGQHACLVADELGMETVFIHPFAGVLSAYGMGLADQSVIREQAIELALEPTSLPAIEAELDALAAAPGPPPGRRDRLEHVSLCLPEQVAAIARSGVAVVNQPSFLVHRAGKYRAELSEV